jgi:hypothetical protein
MNTKSIIPEAKNGPNLAAGIVARVGTIAIFIVLQAVILFLAAGRLDWTWAWLYLGICLVSVAINGTFLLRTSPETIAELGRPQETQDWDKVVGGLWALVLYLVLPLVAGLDVRYGWTSAHQPGRRMVGSPASSVGQRLPVNPTRSPSGRGLSLPQSVEPAANLLAHLPPHPCQPPPPVI